MVFSSAMSVFKLQNIQTTVEAWKGRPVNVVWKFSTSRTAMSNVCTAVGPTRKEDVAKNHPFFHADHNSRVEFLENGNS